MIPVMFIAFKKSMMGARWGYNPVQIAFYNEKNGK